VRASNERNPRPRVARAQKIIRLHPFLCSALSLPAALVYPLKGGLVDPLMRASSEHILIVRAPRAGGRPGCPSPPAALLNRREQPLPILMSHEGPGFAGFGRYLFAAFDEIAWFSALLRQRQVVVTGAPAKPCRHALPRLFGQTSRISARRSATSSTWFRMSWLVLSARAALK
jgi:hypothetical protein